MTQWGGGKKHKGHLVYANLGFPNTLAATASKIYEVHVRTVVGGVSRDTLNQMGQVQQMATALTATVGGDSWCFAERRIKWFRFASQKGGMLVPT